MNDEHCLEQVIAGKTGYYRYLVNKYKDMLYSVAIGMLKNETLAEEAVQDAFIKAYKGLKSFRGDSKLSTWLYKITVNESLKKLKNGGKFYTDIDIDGLNNDDMIVSSHAVHTLKEEEQKRFIHEVLNEMTPNESLLLRLYYLSEQSVDEISEITGLSKSNIKVILYRARKNFYEILNRILQSELQSIL